MKTCGTTNPCNIVFFAGFFSSIIDVIAMRDLNAAIQAHPNMKLVSSQEAFYDTATAKQLAKNLLAQNRNIQVFATSADQMAKGVEQAVNEANLTKRPEITGAGAGAYGVDATKAARWEGTFIALPYDEGYLGTRMAVRAARGQRLDSSGIDPVARRRLPSFLTTENQAQFANFVPQWAD
ncbi:MAG: substrate-binding domain-containing protein [Pseudoxanthomonas sp.]